MERGGIIVGPGHVVGVSLHGDGLPLRYVHLQRHRKEVRLLGLGTAASVEELGKAIGTRVPLSLVWDGPRCAHRVVQGPSPSDNMLLTAFPNAPLEQLYLSGWSHGAAIGASMMRRDDAHPLFEALRARGFRIVRNAVGPWGLLALRSVLNDTNTTWICAGHAFTFTTDGLTAHKPAAPHSASIRLGDDELPESHALAWTAAWEHLVPSSDRLPTDNSHLKEDRAEEKARLHYERGMIGLAAGLLLLLCTERILHAQAGGEMASSAAQDRAVMLEELSELSSGISSRKALIAELGIGVQRSYAERAALILGDVPAGILLDRLQVDPLIGPMRERERVSVRRGTIHIEGHCDDALLLNKWVEHLRKVKGVNDVRLVAYATAEHDPRPRFQLEVDA